MATYPHALIRTCGHDVGLPDGVAGNSEVGHQNIGAGRVVEQEIMRITGRIHDGSFFSNPTLVARSSPPGVAAQACTSWDCSATGGCTAISNTLRVCWS